VRGISRCTYSVSVILVRVYPKQLSKKTYRVVCNDDKASKTVAEAILPLFPSITLTVKLGKVCNHVTKAMSSWDLSILAADDDDDAKDDDDAEASTMLMLSKQEEPSLSV